MAGELPFFAALTGVGNGDVRDSYTLIFGLLIGFQMALAIGFAAYEACLPYLPKEAK
jgi:hypothetical protein